MAGMDASDAARSLRLKRGEDRRLRAGHLWVFSNEVDIAATPLVGFAPGSRARVLDHRDQFLGYAYVNPHALICARILSRSPVHPVDQSLLAHRLKVALALRERHYPVPYYRLVFGEADGLPGLVLDRYGDVIVGQIATAGMEALRADIEAAVEKVLAPQALVWKNDGGARELEQLPKEAQRRIRRDARRVAGAREGVLQFRRAARRRAQKTGWFYDQAANRELFRRLLWPGARVLDVCSYAGAWAITALRCGAREACASIPRPRRSVRRERNAAAERRVAVGTCAATPSMRSRRCSARGERFDVVVLDPPAFIKRKKDMPRGQAAYRKLNQLAMRLLERDALLVSCSCSYHLAADELLGLIQSAARHTSRFVQVIYSGGQAFDHPVHPAIAETRYLKAFFCRVTRE